MMIDIGKIVKRVQKKKEPSILKQLIDNPENFKMEVYTEGEEIIIKLKRKES